MTKFASVGIRRDVLDTLRRMARIERRPLSTVIELSVNDRLKGYPPAQRAAVASSPVGAP